MTASVNRYISPQNKDMFKKFSIDFNVEHMMCVPFENAPMEVKTFCVSELKCDVNNETFAIYCLVNNIPITLGYFQFDDSNIVESKHFESMINFTKSFNNNLTSSKDYERFKNRNCKCIKQWFFDDKLRNVNLLETIFDYIITYVDTIKKCDMLWFDGINSIVFYPIEKNDCISRYAKIKSHFVTEFIKL